jgi:hypothetical protein
MRLYSYIGKGEFTSIDFKSILSKFVYETQDNDTSLSRERRVPLSDNSNTLFWQNYPPSLAFARNFYINNKEYCTKVFELLTNVQNRLIPTNDLQRIFKNESLSPERVNLIRVKGNVQTHKDHTRNYGLTIGIDNCDDYRTYIYETQIVSECSILPKNYYQVKMNEIYISNFHHCHGVESLTDISSIRYVITYNMKYFD